MKRIISIYTSLITVLFLSLAMPTLCSARESAKIPNKIAEFNRLDKVNVLSLWNNESKAKKELISFVKAIIDKRSPNYIPVNDRIAVFDFDGTLFCETDPNYEQSLCHHERNRSATSFIFRQQFWGQQYGKLCHQ